MKEIGSFSGLDGYGFVEDWRFQLPENLNGNAGPDDGFCRKYWTDWALERPNQG